MPILTKLLLMIALGLSTCVALIYLITDRFSTYMNLYNFASFAGIFFGGAAGLTLLALIFRKLRGRDVRRERMLGWLYHSFMVMVGGLFILGLSSYDYASPRPVSFGADYSYVYQPPSKLDDGWEVSTLSAEGMNTGVLGRVVERLVNDRGWKRIHGMLLVRGGKLVAEEYFYDHSRGQLHDMRSATKSISSLLVGIAIDRKILAGVEAKVLDFFPEGSFANWDERKRDVTVRDLLTMSAKLECDDWNRESLGNENKMYQTDDWVKFVLDLPIVEVDGRPSRYCTGGVVVLGAILAKASGQPLQDFAREVLFDPLGIHNAEFEFTPTGRVDSGGHLRMTPRDMAKIGQLVLNRGVWQGRRIVSAAWVDEATAHHTVLPQRRLGNPEYGYLWWRVAFDVEGAPTPAMQALGNGGQYIAIFPELDLVAVFTGGNHGNPRMLVPFEILRNHILPSLTRRRGENLERLVAPGP